jgi:hypothetical protein
MNHLIGHSNIKRRMAMPSLYGAAEICNVAGLRWLSQEKKFVGIPHGKGENCLSFPVLVATTSLSHMKYQIGEAGRDASDPNHAHKQFTISSISLLSGAKPKIRERNISFF